jgi:tetratricopeptide (TPR) repeat protein
MLYLDDRPEETHVGDAADRAMWQEALLNRVNGAPHRKHVADDWPKSFWTMLPEIIEPGEAEELLGELFEHSFDELQNLTSEAREKLEDIYLEELEILPDKAKALAFLTRAIADQKEPERRIHWQIKQIDYYLFEVGDLKIARRLADQLQSGPLRVGPVDAALRLVQRGDIERLDGDLDKAQQFYASAQQEYRRSMATPGSGAALGSAMDRPVAPQKPQTGPPSAAGMVIEAAKGTQTDWRVRAVRQNARFTHVNSLLDQHYIAEARQAFEQWIVEFPFSKLSGDYVLAEARYYSLIGNDARAVRILKAYRKQTEISNELPPAMELELKCLVALKTTGTSGAGRQADIKELCDDMKKRFPDLPLAQEADKATEEVQPPPQTIRAFPTFPK